MLGALYRSVSHIGRTVDSDADRPKIPAQQLIDRDLSHNIWIFFAKHLRYDLSNYSPMFRYLIIQKL